MSRIRLARMSPFRARDNDNDWLQSARNGQSTYLSELLTITFRIVASRESAVYGVR